MIFAREPRLGRVKTRLAAAIGEAAALRFYRSNLGAVARRLAADRRWRTWLGVTPDASAAGARAWPPGARRVARVAQGGGDLGARMARCMAGFGTDPVVVVGSDVPGISRADVAAAFGALRRADVVFGPSVDGGFWLVGAARGAAAAGMFGDVRWSGPHALADTLRGLPPGARTGFLDDRLDVDDGPSYRLWRDGAPVTGRIRRGAA